MKNLIKLTVLISLFFGALYAQNINECKTDIYFGNGVWNSAKDTESSMRELHERIINPFIIKNDPKLKAKYGQIKLQYNWGQGAMLDVLETYYQLKEAGQVSDYQFFAVIALLTKGNPTLTLGAVASKELMEPFTRGWEQGNVDDMWQKYYDESFKLSHKVLLISHSQGNLFANRVYDTINPTGYRDYFANLQIASPASEVKAPKGDYVTLSTDLTSFDPVINFIPSSMSPNASGKSGHALVSAYLSQADPLSKITTKTKQLLANLDTEPSQWELDNELNKGTKDYKITLKHRFDTTITSMQDVEVYPFNPSKKLYHVVDNTINGNGWVKASCGGNEVFDSWITQKDGEAYLINNLEKEMILLERVIYALATIHPCGNINCSGNQVRIVKLIVEPDSFKVLEYLNLKTLGSFTNNSQLYNMWYSTASKPVNGYSVLWLYQGTEFEGLSERYMYPSNSLEELASKITYPVKMASNYANGNLHRDDNFWTNFLPTHLLIESIISINSN
ncbi:MAG: hypothetical protein QM497_09650 [Sulfurimonas sp.]